MIVHPPALFSRWVAKSSLAFTLIEMLIVLIIISALYLIAVPSYREYIRRAEILTTITDIQLIEQAIERYLVTSNGALPNSLADVGMGGLKDPWGNTYRYLNITIKKNNGKVRKDKNLHPLNSDYDLYSMGADGKSASPLTAKISQDDIIRASDGAFIGLAADY